jgi:hypothetical protein
MLAMTGEPSGDQPFWCAEAKWDGWRALVYVDDSLRVRTRTGRQVGDSLPELTGLVDALDGHRVILDGELVACPRTCWISCRFRADELWSETLPACRGQRWSSASTPRGDLARVRLGRPTGTSAVALVADIAALGLIEGMSVWASVDPARIDIFESGTP